MFCGAGCPPSLRRMQTPSATCLRGVAMPVVHQLELIQIEKHDAKRPPVLHTELDALFYVQPVRKPGGHIPKRQVFGFSQFALIR